MDRYTILKMKNIINHFAIAVTAVSSIILLGLLIPMLLSIFVIMTTKVTITECVQYPPFWIVAVIGWICAAIYINDIVTRNE